MRLIDADALVKAVEKEKIFIRPHDDPFEVVREQGRRLKKCVMEAPTIQAVPVVPARWELHGDDDSLSGSYFCSFCGWNFPEEEFLDHFSSWVFCPRCGSKMKEENL